MPRAESVPELIAARPCLPQTNHRVYNVHHFEDNAGVISVEAIAAIINAEAPDLVGLQEVDRCAVRTGGVDFTAELERLTGMRAVFGDNLALGSEGEYGNAILSKLPVVRSDNRLLPKLDGGTEQRGLLWATVSTNDDGGSLVFATTHLEHTSAAERAHQVAAVRQILATVVADAPLVLCGDFNARPHNDELEEMFSGGWGLIDAWEEWEESGDGTDGFTIPSEPAPRARIDYIILEAAAGLTAVEARVAAEQNPGASDHLPVVADITVQTPATAAVSSSGGGSRL